MNWVLVGNEAVGACVNLVVLVVIPLTLYVIWQRSRCRRSYREIASRIGWQIGKPRYLLLCSLLALVLIVLLVLFPPDSGFARHPNNAMRQFAGLGINPTSILMALIYGVIKTGFAEEFLFRGLLCGILSRRFTIPQANLGQSLVFLLPHLMILAVAPGLWWLLVLIFAGSLFAGWVRIRSHSFLGPWIIHAVVNVTTCLLMAAASVPG